MKKMYAMLAVVFAFSAIGSATIFAEEAQQKLPAIEQSEQNDMALINQYSTTKGKINDIKKEEGYYVISFTETEDEAGILFTAEESAFILNSENGDFMTFDELQNGMIITAIKAKNAPMTMSLPPMTNAIGFVVGEENFVTTGYFNEEWTSEYTQPMLQLNISEETKIVDSKGTRKAFTQQDVQNTDCVVIYGATTRSIPAQTTPVFVMILDKVEAEEIEENAVDTKEAEELTEQPQIQPPQTEQPTIQQLPEPKTEQTPIQDLPAQLSVPETEPAPEGNFVPLREAAEKEGFTVTWTANDKPVILQKEGVTIEVTVGQKEYKKNGEVLQAVREAKLMQSKIYVSEDIIL